MKRLGFTWSNDGYQPCLLCVGLVITDRVMSMNKKIDITALGELLVDMVEGPISEQGNMTFEACPGGAPCNLLAMAGRAGLRTAFIGKVGEDFLGQMLADTVRDAGINTEGLVYDPDVKTTLAFVHRKADGDRAFSFYRNPGADMQLGPSEVKADLIRDSRIFHFGTLSMTSETVRNATMLAVEIAKDEDVLISFDPNLRPPLWDSMEDARKQMLWGMNNCDILKLSDDEAAFITGTEDMQKAMEKVAELTTARVIFLTLGKNGSMGWQREWSNGQAEYCKAVQVNRVVDATGAGDAFFGMALAHILNKYEDLNINREEMRDILAEANRAAARITLVKGALKAMSTI